jgi:hypothetical protein
MKMQPVYYQDPGHGWVAVKREYLKQLGIEDKITPYSYQRGGTVYLEEDCDMTTFHNAAKAAGWEVNYLPRHTDRNSPIRSYERFVPEAA